MKPVCQERADDCLPACLASLLELPLGVVANYARHTRGMVGQLCAHQRWLRRIGWTIVEIPLVKPKRGKRQRWPWLPMAAPCYVIVCAKVSNGSDHGHHALIGKITGSRLDVVHDPSPQPWSVVEPIAIAFLVPAIKVRHRDASAVVRTTASRRVRGPIPRPSHG